MNSFGSFFLQKCLQLKKKSYICTVNLKFVSLFKLLNYEEIINFTICILCTGC